MYLEVQEASVSSDFLDTFEGFVSRTKLHFDKVSLFGCFAVILFAFFK